MKYVVPIRFTYEAMFLVEAPSKKEAQLSILCAHDNHPGVWSGKEIKTFDNTETPTWDSIMLCTPVALEKETEVNVPLATTKSTKRRKK